MNVAFTALLATLLGLSLVGGEASAARVTKKKVTAKKAAQKKTSQVPAKVLPAKAEVTPAPAPPVAAQVQTSKATVAETVAPAQPKRWGLLIDLWAEGHVNGIHRANSGGTYGSEAMENSIQIRPSYKITDVASVAVGLDMYHTFGSKTGTDNGQFTVYDSFAQVAMSKLFAVGLIKTKGYVRTYLPTSAGSRDPESGRYAAVRAGFTTALPLSRGLELTYNIEPRYFFQRNMSYTNDDGEWTAQENYRLKHWLGLSAEAGKFSAYQNIGLRSRYFHQDSDAQTGETLFAPQQDNLYWETGVGYQIIDNFALNAGYYTESNDIRRPDFVVFDDTKYLYFVEGVVTF